MAIVTRSILIDASAERVFEQCIAADDYPLIIEGLQLRPSGPGRLRWATDAEGPCAGGRSGELFLLRQEPPRLLVWAQAGSFPVNISVALAPLAGGATWLTCSFELPVAAGDTGAADRLARIASWLNTTLSSLRAFVEARYQPPREASGCLGQNGGAD